MGTSLPTVPPVIAGHIVAVANRHAIPVHLVAAICAKESSFFSGAWRPEPVYRYLWDVKRGERFRQLTPAEIASEVPPPDFPKVGGPSAQEWWGQQASWGLMQVMGANAREHGFRGVYFTDLCEPEIGLEFGCRFLARLLGRNDVEDAVSAYNWGHPSPKNFENYVQPVMRWAAGYKAVGI
jgi:hypothetical protein